MKANTKKNIANTVKLAVMTLLTIFIPIVLRKKPHKGG